MAGHKRFAAAVLAAAALLVVLSSCLFIVGHADHDCTGEDCPVCEQIAVCIQSLNTAAAAAAAAALAVILPFRIREGRKAAALLCAVDSPVSLKVKLSN